MSTTFPLCCIILCAVHLLFNPLITDDTFWHSLTLATYYQLAQSLYIAAALTSCKQPWLAVAGPFLTQMDVETTPIVVKELRHSWDRSP